ncbi:hypothetical protein ASPBRDRAFT_613550 [Aspergillus brasiliensis CBS 101740]|uniref:Uncharacterized protein n=1 Tax=Aspergillus brasiliensis (strain CBS 101740 / IMI 381727 / IBT 21946) TaxID=767769 RepID=A0A1L9UII3_ASPBC|nr:hypothetical protein ASPBRDRAFT_613550 [Aspergillus brasiliensis CBS 101740]
MVSAHQKCSLNIHYFIILVGAATTILYLVKDGKCRCSSMAERGKRRAVTARLRPFPGISAYRPMPGSGRCWGCASLPLPYLPIRVYGVPLAYLSTHSLIFYKIHKTMALQETYRPNTQGALSGGLERPTIGVECSARCSYTQRA